MLMFRPFVKYADFSGRARRSEYWLFQLFQVLACLALIAFMITGLSRGAAGAIAGGMLGMGLIGLLVLGCLLPNLAVTVRRLHDSNKSAWWMLLYVPGIFSWGHNFQTLANIGTPYNANRSAELAATVGQGAMIGMVALLANLTMFILMCLPGTRGPNRFGPDPKGDGTDIARTFDGPDFDSPTSPTPNTSIFDFGDAPSPSRTQAAPQPQASKPQSYTPQPYTAPSRPAPPPFSTARPTFGKRR